jgi:hypothetical protein
MATTFRAASGRFVRFDSMNQATTTGTEAITNEFDVFMRSPSSARPARRVEPRRASRRAVGTIFSLARRLKTMASSSA